MDGVNWATAHGASLQYATLANLPGRGTGVVAFSPIRAGEVILRVPHSLLLTSTDEAGARFGATNALALALLQERDKANSFWSKYLSTLPGIIPTPLHFNETEQDDLVGTDLLRWVRSRQKHVAKTHAVLLEHLAESAAVDANGASSSFNAPSLDEFTWALSIAWSRGHTLDMAAVRGLGAAKRPGLVPIGDCFNHAEERFANVVTKSDPANGVFDFVAMRDVKTGDELLVSYSLHSEPSNSKLLLDYGFCTPYSLHDEVSVDLQLAGEIKPAMAKLLQALQLTDYVREARLTLGPDSMNPPDALIASGRVLALEEPALSQATVESVLEAQSDASFEVAVLRLLASRIEKRLRQYDREGISSASNEEDEHALASGAWRYSTGTGCTLHVRAGERRILLHWRRRLLSLAEQAEGSYPRGSLGSRDTFITMPEEPPLQTFLADGVGWDPHYDIPLPKGWGLDDGRSISLEVRTLPSFVAGRALRGVFVAPSSPRLKLGDLAGCYSGSVLGPEKREEKRPTGFEAYCFPINSTHVIDPTEDDGHVPDDSVHQMAFVNEPTGDEMPNLTPMDYRYGLCKDRFGKPGVPYYAVRDVLPGEALTVCYGPGYDRAYGPKGRHRYETVCSDAELLGRWTALQERLLRPVLHWRVGVPGR